MSVEVYKGITEEGSDSFVVHPGLTRAEHIRMVSLFGEPLAASWRPVWLAAAANSDDGRVAFRFDVTDGGGSLLLRPSGRAVLDEVLGPHGEMLPVEGEGEEGPLWLFNCTTVVEAFDWGAIEAEAASRGLLPYIDLEDGTGHVGLLGDPIFVPERVPDVPVFKVRNVAHLYLTRSFVDTVRASGLRGLVFRRVWPPTPDRRS